MAANPVRVPITGGVWDGVLELTKVAQERNTDPFVWALQLGSLLNSSGVTLPSVEFAHLLVSHICWSNNVPVAWKFLEKSLALKLAPPLLVLALLSTRVIPARRSFPASYRLYMELLKRHGFYSIPQMHGSCLEKVMKSIDDILHLSEIYGVQTCEPGVTVVMLVFSFVWQFLDASLDDEGLLDLTPDKNSIWLTREQDMEVDGCNRLEEKRTAHNEGICSVHTVMAIEIIGEILLNDKVTSKILYLVRRNMPSHWEAFVLRLRLLAIKSTSLRNSKRITPETVLQLSSNTYKVLPRESRKSIQHEFHALMASGSLIPSVGQCHGASRSALWLPVDLFLEDAMDGLIVAATSAVDTLTDLVKSLQALNHTTWQDAFLGLWIAALRLVQRERNPSEGPVPRLDTCLCMLLSVTTLAVFNIIDEEENPQHEEMEYSSTPQKKVKKTVRSRRSELVSSLQLLGECEDLLTPPLPVISQANQAAAKAMMYLSGLNICSGYLDCISMNDMPMNISGNMRHLIVEACIARNLLDTSAYMWPGYVNGRSGQIPRSLGGPVAGWSSLMKGAPLTPALVSALVSNPALSLAEIEKIYEIATSGPEDEKVQAATVLCGASLVRGWNVQEHAVLFITRLLSPPMPAEDSGSDNHLINYAPFLNALLVGISTIDIVQIFALHGLVGWDPLKIFFLLSFVSEKLVKLAEWKLLERCTGA